MVGFNLESAKSYCKSNFITSVVHLLNVIHFATPTYTSKAGWSVQSVHRGSGCEQ